MKSIFSSTTVSVIKARRRMFKPLTERAPVPHKGKPVRAVSVHNGQWQVQRMIAAHGSREESCWEYLFSPTDKKMAIEQMDYVSVGN